jgi:hypothetical protein
MIRAIKSSLLNNRLNFKSMQYRIRLTFLMFVITCFFCASSCNRGRGPDLFPNKNIKGYIIGKETCNADSTKDYWLIDFTFGTSNPHVGDTLLLNNITYTNVLKTKGLAEQLKVIGGYPVSIDYRSISSNKIISTGCSVSNPITYPLKEVMILNQGEIH